MYKNFSQLTIGTTYYQWRSYVGFVEFEIINKDDEVFCAKSISNIGYDVEISKKLFDKMIAVGYHFYESLEEAKLAKAQEDKKRKTKYIKQFSDNKELFVKEMILKAYQKEMNGEYGDYIEAKAIEELASIHYPELKFF